MKKELLSIENGRCAGGGRRSMYSIFLQVLDGDLMGIAADNSSDLETILRILSGQKKLDQGRISIRENPLGAKEDIEELKKQTAVISSKSALIPNLTIAQNIFAIQKKTAIFFRKKESEFQLRKKMDLLGIRLSVDMPVKKLNIVQRIELEMLKAWLLGHAVIALDLRDVYFSEEELSVLKQYLERYRKLECGILILDLNMNRLAYLTKKITVLSGGKTIGVFACDERIQQKLRNIFRNPEETVEPRASGAAEKEVFCADHVQIPGLSELNFAVREGETMILQAPDWKCSEKLLALFKGELSPESGNIRIRGRNYQALGAAGAPGQSVVILEPPYQESLFGNLSVYDNFCIARGCIRKGLWANKHYRQSIRDYIRKVFGKDISENKVTELTAREAQRLVWYRWIFFAPELLVCVDPADSVDLDLRKDIREYLSLLSERGTALILIERNAWKDYGDPGRCIRISGSGPEH